jgi:prolyl oligopeptidase
MRAELCVTASWMALTLSSIAVAQTGRPIHGKDGITLPAPPPTAQHAVTDTYKVSGARDVTITDPYRWLEDAKSPATRAFIASQNAYTQKYLDQVKILPEVRTQMAALLRVDQIGTPIERAGFYFFERQLADENQSSIYMRTSLHGTDIKLIDGNALSKDGNTSANLEDVYQDGSLLLYGVRVGGADESEIHFFDIKSRHDTADVLPSARYYGVQIAPDRKGAYYSRFYPKVGCKVFYHAFGTPIASDAMLLGGEYHGEKLGEIDGIELNVTESGHYLVMSVFRGVPPKREDILLKDLRTPNSAVVPLVYGYDSRFNEMSAGDQFFVETDFGAPNHRVLKAVPGEKPEQWQTIIPETKDAIDEVSIVGGKLFVLRLHDVISEVTAYTLDGKEAGKIDFPGIGAGSGLFGHENRKDGFYTFQSIVTPPSVFHYDTATGKSEIFYTQKVPFDSSAYELKEVFFTSKDGIRVPMFVAGKKGLKRDGSERLLMTGYGGFQVSMTPKWNPEYAWWLSRGGYFALPDLRGGNEYGEAWHKAAMFDKKQNVFDDWFAAAEYLIANKYTSAEHFAIRGRSNGGLLMGASMTQRPDLFGAIWCGYPLLDMLRYQNFEMGGTWTTEYGSADNPTDFRYLRAYSPYQNVKPATKYPAIMFFTGDGDTRVDPMNARKMTPLVQAASSSGRPILLHYSVKGGHSAGISQTQLVEDYADEMSFLWTETK